jgi:steroid delta-isomerase-like uncharacterized protein
MKLSQNTTTVLDLIAAAWNRGDLSAIDRAVADDHIEHEPEGDEIGRDHLAQTVQAYRAAFPDLRIAVDDQIAGGDRVVIRWTGTGTHRGELNGIPATGRTATVSGVFIHKLAGGLITESWSMFDQLGLLAQLGVFQPEQIAAHAARTDGP